MSAEAREALRSHSRRVVRLGGALILCLAASLGWATAPASATKTHLFEGNFGSAAQPVLGSANGLAIDPTSGDLLVIDSQAMTVSRFKPDGTPDDFSALGTNVIDAKGTGKCPTVAADCDQTPQNGFIFDAFSGSQQVAVDSSGTATDGNIYVTQGRQAAGNLVDIFASSGKYIGQLTADKNGAAFGTTGSFPFSPCGVAVDGGGNLFVAGGFDNKIYRFDPAANPPVNADNTATFNTSDNVCSLAAGAGPSASSLFATNYGTLKENGAFKLDSTSGAPEGIIESGEARLVSVDFSSGHVYVLGGNIKNENKSFVDVRINEYDASSSTANLLSSTLAAASTAGLAADGAHLYLTQNEQGIYVYGPLVTVPDVTTGAATITGDTAATLKGTVDPDGVALEECRFEYGPTSSYGQSAPCAESVAEIGTAPTEVHADVSGLTPESLYHYRLVAKNPNTTINGADKTFRTPGKPAIVGLWSTEVGFNEATLKAQINPENSPTTYRFEWGTDASYGNATAEIAVGSDNSDHIVALPLNGLQPGATYHYRVVASNGIGVSEAPDHAFTTYPAARAPRTDCPNQSFRTGPSATLPECRAYEMVSPVDKNGGDIKVLSSNLNFPARLEQSSADGNRFAFSSGTAFAGAVSAPWTSSYLATRRAGEGWFTDSISPPRQSTSLYEVQLFAKFDIQYKAFSADLSQGWLLHDTDPPLDECGVEGFPNLYHRDNATGAYEALAPVKPLGGGANHGYVFELQGVSADGAHAVFRSNAKLTSGALGVSSPIDFQIYEHVRGEGCGELRLVSVLPNGKPSPPSNSVGTAAGQSGESRSNTVARGVSTDGSRIFWSRSTDGASPGPLYVRIDGKETIQISAETSRFWTAATDGSKALYSVADTGSPLNRNLYEFDLASKSSTLIAEDAHGVVGASEDLSRVYFVSDKALDGDAEVGKPNLYLREGGSMRFIATLFSVAGLGAHTPLALIGTPNQLGVRVSADGAHLAFVSDASLTSYDNNDAADGRPAVEVYRYDAETDDLACVSCNPSGARPFGRELDEGALGSGQVAAQLPPAENQSFFPRALSADGNRLFFEAFDALLPRDTNGMADVYEWQRAADAEQCAREGAELYVPSSGGCLSLISSGQSPTDSELADASPDGADVFIRTAQSLLPQDPGQVDLYDARVNGGLPLPPGLPAACEGEACQGPVAPPNDATPASSAFHGPGNVNEGAPKPRCPKGKVRRKGRCVAKKQAANKPHKQAKRANHNRRAGR